MNRTILLQITANNINTPIMYVIESVTRLKVLWGNLTLKTRKEKEHYKAIMCLADITYKVLPFL